MTYVNRVLILGMMATFLLLSACSAQRELETRDISPYQLYNGDGKKMTYPEMVTLARSHDIILFGELHNSAIAHWLQHELARDLYLDKRRLLVVGMEMFEADQQQLLDQYLDGTITQSAFEEQARLWTNYDTDYKPIVEFAKEEGIRVVATNIPRRYANMVYHEGIHILDELNAEAKSWMAPLPLEIDLQLPGYVQISEMAHGHGGDHLPQSQAVKDATMAHFILKNRARNTRHLHLNGAYHSDNFEGIYWYLRHYGFEGTILTVTTIETAEVGTFDPDEANRANIILKVNERVPHTY